MTGLVLGVVVGLAAAVQLFRREYGTAISRSFRSTGAARAGFVVDAAGSLRVAAVEPPDSRDRASCSTIGVGFGSSSCGSSRPAYRVDFALAGCRPPTSSPTGAPATERFARRGEPFDGRRWSPPPSARSVEARRRRIFVEPR